MARNYGFIDPINFLAQLRRFAQPSEVQEPIELLRAGIIFHARGLVNTKTIQYNLDWVWPYWVAKQFDPEDIAFIPRGFSFSHVNLTHRNWTAVGHPDVPLYPIVDPSGLVTPLYDGWSIDSWILGDKGQDLIPSQSKQTEQTDQHLTIEENIKVVTSCKSADHELVSSTELILEQNSPHLIIEARGLSQKGGWLAIAVRPYNPEGIQFIEKIAVDHQQKSLTVDDSWQIIFDQKADKVLFSNYETGDVRHRSIQPDNPQDSPEATTTVCPIGMATGMSLFRLPANVNRCVKIDMDLTRELKREKKVVPSVRKQWRDYVAGSAQLEVPDPLIQNLYDIALRTLILLSADDVVPGSYTYRRFWFRDACFMLQALLVIGLEKRAGCILSRFPDRQGIDGYFHSQEGEWDSNGQVLWIVERYHQLANAPLDAKWLKSIWKAANWIARKRIRRAKNLPHEGLLPAGFSAEHLGPNDHYYWDNFWSLAGLFSAARLLKRFDSKKRHKTVKNWAEQLHQSIIKSIANIPSNKSQGGIPASPYRRMDAGAIGSLVADSPLQLTPMGDTHVLKTADFLITNCFHQGAFFQDMIHSGLNAYLTLAIAQTLLRNGDSRFIPMIRKVAHMASPTGQWPEAVHPGTGGGCMGDGQHGWAAAEWLMMIRNLFIREEGDLLILGAGIFPEWLKKGTKIKFGPTLTAFGPITATFEAFNSQLVVEFDVDFYHQHPSGRIAVPGYPPIQIDDFTVPYTLEATQP